MLNRKNEPSRVLLRPGIISASVSVSLAAAFISAPAFAQTHSDDADVEIIEVSGLRSSVIKSMDIKRSEKGVVDAITADDIGKFPDTNLAESLQRITGVSIDRKNNEGNQISVRGFGPSFNLVTLNGRQMPSAATQKQEGDSTQEQSRAFNFAEIAADSVAGIEVYKTVRANLPTGGIGATVNIVTAKPLNIDGTKFVGSVKGIVDTSVETGNDVTPEVSGMFSTNIDDTFGFLVTASFSERHNRQNSVLTDGWLRVSPYEGLDVSAIDPNINPTGQIWMPRNVVVDQSDHERERTNAQVVLQHAPADTFTATLDYTISDFENTVQRSQTGLWIEAPRPTGSVDATGSATNLLLTADPATNFGALDFQGYTDEIVTENKSLGVNFAWQATDTLQLTLDYHDSESVAQPDGQVSDFLVILSGPLGATSAVNFGNGIPTVNVAFEPAGNGGASTAQTWYDPNNLRPNIDLARNKSVENTVEQIQFDGAWVNSNDSALAQINFGLARTDYEIETGWLFDLGVQGQPNCGEQCAQVVTLEETHFPNVFPLMQTFNARQVFESFLSSFPTGFESRFTNINRIQEESTSVYVSFDLETEFNDMPVNITAGVRYESTDVTGTTLQSLPEAMIYISDTEFRPQFTDDEQEFSIDSDYRYFLPALDVSVEAFDDVVTRFSYGRSLARSDLNSMKPALTIGDARPGGPYNAFQGNPGLLPYLSDNIDLAVEWYYQEGSYAAINYFKKWVDNYVVTSIRQGTIEGALGYDLSDPNPGDDPSFPANTVGGPDDQVINWDIQSFDNAESASVYGFELALQHLFSDSGFGLQANATFVEGDVEYGVSRLDQTVALTGLSDSANLVAFYENDGWQVRLAYNWRDEFLLAVNQLRQVNEPVFVEAYGQWDISASYDINDNWNVFVEGINITGEDAEAHGRFEQQFIYHDDQEARYAIGVRAKF